MQVSGAVFESLPQLVLQLWVLYGGGAGDAKNSGSCPPKSFEVQSRFAEYLVLWSLCSSLLSVTFAVLKGNLDFKRFTSRSVGITAASFVQVRILIELMLTLLVPLVPLVPLSLLLLLALLTLLTLRMLRWWPVSPRSSPRRRNSTRHEMSSVLSRWACRFWCCYWAS